MERHKCKLCFRSFSNGRALGGHMRSHMMNLPIPPKEEDPPPPPPSPAPAEVGEEAESASSPSQSSEDEKALYYGLRENPKRSIKLVDPEFSFAVVDSGSVVILQDRESETESSKNPTRRRSKRTRKSGRINDNCHEQELGKASYFNNKDKAESWAEPEPVSSVSDATTEEDVAFCLMMMSRDKWKRREVEEEEEEEDFGDGHYKEDDEEEDDDDGEESDDDEFEEREELVKSARINNPSRNKYRCETCNKAFRSYQALGGHRASHKKIKLSTSESNNNELVPPERAKQKEKVNAVVAAEKKVHACPVCFRVFSSGQALGGHKRSHVIAANNSATATTKQHVVVVNRRLNKLGESLIDLNLPAPDYDDDHGDDDEISQIELSAVSDAEFVNPIIRQ